MNTLYKAMFLAACAIAYVIHAVGMAAISGLTF